MLLHRTEGNATSVFLGFSKTAAMKRFPERFFKPIICLMSFYTARSECSQDCKTVGIHTHGTAWKGLMESDSNRLERWGWILMLCEKMWILTSWINWPQTYGLLYTPEGERTQLCVCVKFFLSEWLMSSDTCKCTHTHTLAHTHTQTNTHSLAHTHTHYNWFPHASLSDSFSVKSSYLLTLRNFLFLLFFSP